MDLYKILSVLGGFAFVFSAIEFFWKFFQMPTIELSVTKDIFFRLTEDGESIFVNIVIVARHGVVELRDIDISVNKIDGKKQIGFMVEKIGKYKESTTSFMDYQFYSASPIDFIVPQRVQRTVCYAVQKFEQVKLINLLRSYNTEVLKLKPSLDQARIKEDTTEAEKAAIVQSFNDIKNRYLSQILQYIQLEDGKYRLILKVTYKDPSFKQYFQIKQKCKTRMIEFDVENFKEIYNYQLEQFLDQQGRKLLGETNISVLYPTYTPINISEDCESI